MHNLQALSSALASLGRHNPGPSGINSVDPCVLKSNYYLDLSLSMPLQYGHQILPNRVEMIQRRAA